MPPQEFPVCTQPIRLFPVAVSWPDDPETDPDDAPVPGPPYDPASLRLMAAEEVRAGDLILGAVDASAVDRALVGVAYHQATYEAAPQPFDPGCRCGVCDIYAARRAADMVVIHPAPPPWPDVCDAASRDELVLVVPAVLR